MRGSASCERTVFRRRGPLCPARRARCDNNRVRLFGMFAVQILWTALWCPLWAKGSFGRQRSDAPVENSDERRHAGVRRDVPNVKVGARDAQL